MLGAGGRSSASRWRIWGPLLLLVVAFVIFPATAAAYIYFPNGVNIGRALNDGTGVEPKFITSNAFNCGVAVDGEHIYWGALGKGISRANLDGTGIEEEFIPLSPTAAPCGVAVDSGHVYWTDRTCAVGIADIDGDNVNPAQISIGEQCGIAAAGDHVYFAWSSGGGFSLSRFSLPYSGLEPPLTATTGNCGVAVDSQNVYWANGGPSSTNGFTVQFANRDPFGAPVTLVQTEGGTKKPWSVAVHGEYAYYSSYGGPIGRVRVDGSAAPQPNFLPLGGSVETVGIALDDLPLPPSSSSPSSPTPPSSPAGSGAGGSAAPALVKPKLMLGTVKTNVRNGTAKVTATVSAPGVVTVAGKKVRPAKASATRAGNVSLTIRAKKSAISVLRKVGHLRVSFAVAFAAPGTEPVSARRSVKLVLAGD